MTQRSLRRAELIHEMERLYTDRAYSDSELAARFDVDRTTVFRARRFMELDLGLPFIEEARGTYRLDPQRRLSNIRLTALEAVSLYLGGRRLQQQTRTAHQPTATALEKLARALRQPMMERLARAAREVLQQEDDPSQARILEQLVTGWIDNRKVRLRYRSTRSATARTHVVCPYQLEPAVWGDGLYLIAHSDVHDKIITFKVARIESATVTGEAFVTPEDFDSHTLLAHAWGIWHTDEPPVEVRLRFSQRVTARVKESIWHPSQTIRDLPDGGCEWLARIADVREIAPWVRSWGADVEALAPEALRRDIRDHVRRMTALYD